MNLHKPPGIDADNILKHDSSNAEFEYHTQNKVIEPDVRG